MNCLIVMMSLFLALMITPPSVSASAPKETIKNHAPTGFDADGKGFSSLRPKLDESTTLIK